jgi:16S rRNA (uracil1498-N3)-methyltransferase
MPKSVPEPLRRFYVSPDQVQGEEVWLDPEETRHLSRVLRLGVGARVMVCDGRGRLWEAVVQTVGPGRATLKLVKEMAPWGESLLELTLGLGLAKGEALDTAIRQATEMGVKLILPFTSARSEKLTPERISRRRWRWLRVARESLKSCQRSYLPYIAPPQEFGAVLSGPEAAKLIFWEEERGGGLKSCLDAPRPASARVLIGPEGGFTPEEVAQARAAGYEVASLGPRRLKVETATMAALTLLQYAWGDLA